MKGYGFLLLLAVVGFASTVNPQSGPPVTKIEIIFSGNERVSSSELIEDFKNCSKSSWKSFDKKAYAYFAQKCSRQLMFSKGFWQAKVGDISPRAENETLVVQIQMIEGPRYRLGRVVIQGNEVLSENEIIAMMGQTSGEVADGRAMQDLVLDKLKQKYDGLGYVQYNADFEPSFINPVDWKLDGIVNVVITIDEGRQFKVRRIILVGVDDSERQALLGSFLIKPGDIFSSGRLQDAIDKFNELERFRAVDKDQDVEIRTDEEGGDVELVLTVEKGNR
jgi:outer membrane protein insertion porin family